MGCEKFHSEAIPQPARRRLLYLLKLLESRVGGKPITSAEVEALSGWPRETIRKDVSCLELPVAGTAAGYEPGALAAAIREGLGLNRRIKFCIVGLGRLGAAYLNYFAGLMERGRAEGATGGFELAAGFDSNVNRVEILKSPAPLYPAYKMGEVVRRFGIDAALLCVPESAAQASAEKLSEAGIRGIINFSAAALVLPKEVTVRNVDLLDELRAIASELYL
jgi:redox-sensing transcriptional repressor